MHLMVLLVADDLFQGSALVPALELYTGYFSLKACFNSLDTCHLRR
jgi:hypothetical protein